MAFNHSFRIGLLALVLAVLSATAYRPDAFGQTRPPSNPDQENPNGLSCYFSATFFCSYACGGGTIAYTTCIDAGILSDYCDQPYDVYCDDCLAANEC